MREDVQRYVSTCDRCQLGKVRPNLNKAPLQPIVTESPRSVWAIDVLGPLPLTRNGNQYLVVMCDLFSKWVEAAATPDQTAVTIVDILLKHVILRHGVPEKILSDQGPCFEAAITSELCRRLRITKLRTSPYNPRTDGQTERFNRTFRQFVTTGSSGWEKNRFPVRCVPTIVCVIAVLKCLHSK